MVGSIKDHPIGVALALVVDGDNGFVVKVVA